MTAVALGDWEFVWAPYDDLTYQQVLSFLQPSDVVLDIGAGDLRLARQMAARVRRVYAIEKSARLLQSAIVPLNVSIMHGDARFLHFPDGATTAVLLMRHCRQFRLYVEKLLAVGCRWLITNARWGMNVERIDLRAKRVPYSTVAMGWYACVCGQRGFIPGPPDRLTAVVEEEINEVRDCPACAPTKT